ncbi:MAG: secondary thiamine-phosphate synthase [Robiginitomaculum sp.]|nr:MAG: secondary thiamine-phosphate synthase [Robiginitomaculum sp.]
MQTIFQIHTTGSGLYEFTADVVAFVGEQNMEGGLLTLFVQHTSCSLLISENADPDVKADMDEFFARLVPDGHHKDMAWLRHTCEEPDDMPAHIKAALTPVSLSIPIVNGCLGLGTWQGIYLFEHRIVAHDRRIIGHISR